MISEQYVWLVWSSAFRGPQGGTGRSGRSLPVRIGDPNRGNVRTLLVPLIERRLLVRGVVTRGLTPGADGRVSISALLDELGKRQWTHLLVEGGAKVLESFIQARAADELLAFVSPQKVPADADVKKMPRFDIAALSETLTLPEPQVIEVGTDRLMRYLLRE